MYRRVIDSGPGGRAFRGALTPVAPNARTAKDGAEWRNVVTDKIRIQLDFTREAFDELETLGKKVGASTRAEVVRYSLRILQWTLQQFDEGAQILVEKNHVRQQVVFPFLNVPMREFDARAKSAEHRVPAAASAYKK